MAVLSELKKNGHRAMVTGPYGTAVRFKFRDLLNENPFSAIYIPWNPEIGADTAALLSKDGREILLQIALEYVRSMPLDQLLVMTTPTFRLPKQYLEAAARVEGASKEFPSTGLKMFRNAYKIAVAAMENGGRNRDNTILAVSVGPPFDCYHGEETLIDVASKYHPQVFAAARFSDADYLMFETTPSVQAAIGAAQAFTRAHRRFDLGAEKISGSGTVTYLGDSVAIDIQNGGRNLPYMVPSFDPDTGVFKEIEPEKEYTISFLLEANGELNNGTDDKGRPISVSLDTAINMIYERIATEKLREPIGVGINCNSPEVTEGALSDLSSRNLERVVSIHPNASAVKDPRLYDIMPPDAIEEQEFAERVVSMGNRFNLSVIGGCCMTDSKTMEAVYQTHSHN